MAQVVFIYNQHNIDIQCNKTDKMKDIFNRFYTKTNTSPNTVFFMYNGMGNINGEISFDQLANNFDKSRNKMTILVNDAYFKDTSYLPKTSGNISNNYNNIKPQGKPYIFDNMDNMNKRFEKMEFEIKEKSKELKRKIEIMQTELMKIEKEEIKFADATYYGETLDTKMNGLGILNYDDGTRYEGYFLNGNRNGIGIFYGKNSIFQGEYKKDERNGFGIEENPDVGKYEGDWLNNGINGTGILTYNDGRIYIGQFEKAQRSGFGKMMWTDGDYCIGQFKDSNREKIKTFYAEENGIFDAIWEENDDKAIAKGIFYHYDGRTEKRTRIISGKEAHWEYN